MTDRPPTQIVQNPNGADRHCPKCGGVMDVVSVDDAYERVHIRSCTCGHSDLTVVKRYS